MLHLSEGELTLLVLMAEKTDRGTLFGKLYRTSRGDAWRIDCRPYGWITGLGGVGLRNREMAEAVLNLIRLRVARGEDPGAACAEYLRSTSTLNQVVPIYHRWLQHVEGLVAGGERSPRTLQEYRRYARDGGELSFWGRRSILAVTSHELDRWNAWLVERGLGPKTRRHVVGALRTAYRWAGRGQRWAEPYWPSIAVPEYEPVIVSPSVQDAILERVPEPERGAHLIACHMGLRPGEIRALDAVDYFRAPGDEFAGLRVCKAMQGLEAGAPVGPTKGKRNRNPCCGGVSRGFVPSKSTT